MFTHKLKNKISELETNLHSYTALIESIQKNLAYIEFTPQGDILKANDLFMATIGYSKQELVGQHHKLFCDASFVTTPEYQKLWSTLQAGKSVSGTFERIHKNGQKLWLEATYFPVELDGKVIKVAKIASDITTEYTKLLLQTAITNALDSSMAMIEFTPQGNIVSANKNFLSTMKCSMSEIKGKHHRIFCTDKFYQENPTFWRDLENGEGKTGQYQRIALTGETIWLEATYNPIKAVSGEVVSVIKFAANITPRVERSDAVSAAAEVAYSTAMQTSKIAVQGADILSDAVENSYDVEKKVTASVELIQSLSKQSEQISAIVSTISAIADQTNLLALNAAIEAARAGETGRGFAVVADEVRLLAARTTDSTKEISDVVKLNQDLTKNVSTQVSAVADSTQKGIDLVLGVSEVIKEISAGAENVSQAVAGLSSNPDAK